MSTLEQQRRFNNSPAWGRGPGMMGHAQMKLGTCQLLKKAGRVGTLKLAGKAKSRSHAPSWPIAKPRSLDIGNLNIL